MPSTLSLPQEKIGQATTLLNELQLDCWLLFVRETYEQCDPAFRLISDHDVSAPAAFLLTRTGEQIAIVSSLDETLVTPALYKTIISYREDCASALLETLQRLDPHTIAINYSLSDVPADGLTHGMYLKLQDILKESPLAERLVSLLAH